MELITKAEFALRAGKSKPAITNASKEGGYLHSAIVGGKINIDSQAVHDYCHKHNIDISKKPEREVKKPASKPVSEEGSNGLPPSDFPIENLEKMTLAQLSAMFGTDERFKIWLNARKLIVEIHSKEIDNEVKKGTLINKGLVHSHIIDPFNSANLRLMSDGAKTIAASAVSKHMAGATIPEIEASISEIIGSFIKPVKNKITRALKNV